MTNLEIFELGDKAETYFKLNSKLQQKKNAVRKELASKGILARDKTNTFDKYKYFSEAQYKLLFTELFAKCGLELKYEEIENTPYMGTDKMPFGRIIKLEFTLTDTETGFFETSAVSGEGMDKGDKAGYKAYTGALKYYLANTFMVATGDDLEKDETVKEEKKEEKKEEPRITAQQIEIISKAYQGDGLKKLLAWAKVEKLEDLTMATASSVIKGLREKK